MTTEQIIQQIISNKNRPLLNFSLKLKTEKFTDNLFYTLFDAEACVSTNIEQLEIDFREVYRLACLIRDGSCKKIWDTFLAKLPAIWMRKKSSTMTLLQIQLKKFIWLIPVFTPLPFTGLATNFFC